MEGLSETVGRRLLGFFPRTDRERNEDEILIAINSSFRFELSDSAKRGGWSQEPALIDFDFAQFERLTAARWMADELEDPQEGGEGYFPPPPGLSVHKSIYELFKHFSKPVKTPASQEKDDKDTEILMDGATFAKLCRDCPKLGRRVGRTNVDLIFSKSKPMGIRRLDYEHFLDALLGLAKCIYPEEEPTVAFATLLSQYIFGLYEQARCDPSDNKTTVKRIVDELSRV